MPVGTQGNNTETRGHRRVYPDWLPGVRTANVKLCVTRCSCIAILLVSLVSFTAVTLCVASQVKSKVVPVLS
jgi:hypothetical protein